MVESGSGPEQNPKATFQVDSEKSGCGPVCFSDNVHEKGGQARRPDPPTRPIAGSLTFVVTTIEATNPNLGRRREADCLEHAEGVVLARCGNAPLE